MNIIYLCPNSNAPCGGVKVIYRHSEMLTRAGFSSFVYHPYDPNFRCSWFKNEVQLWKVGTFNKETDFIIVPEAWAESFGQQCVNAGLKFAIFVQNGYFIRPPTGSADVSAKVSSSVYAAADLIMSISDDTTAMVSLSYPSMSSEKLVRLLPNVGDIFDGTLDYSKKELLITYMPRKLKEHSELFCFLLRQNLPETWSLLPIEGLSEIEVAKLLSRSSIFLSFCDMEGCPLPPLEAAFSGNIVVGYTGQGAKEYFRPPVFREINNGDFRHFATTVFGAIADIDDGIFKSDIFLKRIESVKGFYSNDTEMQFLLKFANRVTEIL